MPDLKHTMVHNRFPIAKAEVFKSWSSLWSPTAVSIYRFDDRVIQEKLVFSYVLRHGGQHIFRYWNRGEDVYSKLAWLSSVICSSTWQHHFFGKSVLHRVTAGQVSLLSVKIERVGFGLLGLIRHYLKVLFLLRWATTVCKISEARWGFWRESILRCHP